MGVNADYIYTGERKVSWNESGYNINLSYNPATGVNYPFSDISRRPYPEYGAIDMWIPTDARSNYHALSTAFTKRMSGGVAGLRHLPVVGAVGCVREALQRADAGSLPGGA